MLLASVTDAALVAGYIARAVGIEPVAGQPIEQSLASALADRELLLVLDNFEHLLGGALIVSEVLAAAPGVDVLVTSREPLRIAGEHRVDVPPLELTHARELFVARARGVRRDLAVSQDERSAIDAICEQLDGLPLALELAAARIAVFSPQALRARLADRLSIASRQRDTPERHETLRATLDWSYRLLSHGEQTALAALAPFIGGVRVDDAEQIWGGATVEALVALTEKSLLRRREDTDGQTRFWMLETVRQYAVEQAARTCCLREAADQHARHQLVLSDRAAEGLEGPEQRYWLDRLEPELPNFRGALEHLIRQHAPESVRNGFQPQPFLGDSELPARSQGLAASRARRSCTRQPTLCERIAQCRFGRVLHRRARRRPTARAGRARASRTRREPLDVSVRSPIWAARAGCSATRLAHAPTMARRSGTRVRPPIAPRSPTPSSPTRLAHRSALTQRSRGRSSRRRYVFAGEPPSRT